MIEEVPAEAKKEKNSEVEEENWEDGELKPSNWDHQPKRAKKSHKKEKEEKQVSLEQKRKLKIEDKIFKKVLAQTDENQPTAPGLKTTQGVKVDRQVEHICNILKYMLGEFQLQSAPEYANEERTCQNWQLDEVLKQVQDTNLGDFLMKCPNPDNLPPDWVDKYEVSEKDGELTSPHKLIKISKAMQYFYDLFDVETYSQLQKERENIAFMVAFFFLKYKSNFDQKSDEASESFLKVYDFYKMVEKKSLKDYMQMRQEKMFYQNHEFFIKELFQDEYKLITCFNEKVPMEEEHEEMWKNLVKMIYRNLNAELLSNFGGNQDQDSEQCRFIFGRVKSISELLKTFPDLLEQVLLRVKYFDEAKQKLEQEEKKEEEQRQEELKKEQQNNQNLKGTNVRIGEEKPTTVAIDRGWRSFFWGQYLKKTIVGENIIWVNSKCRPNDVATLLRFSLMYKLIIKSNLQVRTFLSKDQCHIILVIKTSEAILQNYAQKYKLNMEVDLGASDLFSFEPVDDYLRPLRLHRYVTDQQFLDKYHIKPSQAGDDKKEELQSIESEAINIYKKVQVMNEDELRTLVMTDQMQANSLLKYVKKRLNIDYIQQNPLVNDYNKDTTDRQTWEIYYVYNKLIMSFIKRVKGLYSVNRSEKAYYIELEGNIGMLLRLMFLKALHMCNEMYYEHREMRSLMPRILDNFLFTTDRETKLRTIWYYINIPNPSGFCQYYKIDKLERLWRKFEINELKERSKFFPSERLIITNRVILEMLNLSSSLDKKHLLDYYPLHDPYTLKSIEIAPYLSVIKKLRKAPRGPTEHMDASVVTRLYGNYQCKYSVSDFTKMSVEKQLEFKLTQFKTFETSSIRSYCGQKIAFYFTLIKFLALSAWPLVLPAFIIQILLWSENSQILATGSSNLTSLNDVLVIIWVFVNLFWTTHLIESWKEQQRNLAQEYGVTKILDNQERRVKFQGAFKRDFETDELNFEYVPKWQTILKAIFTLVLNLAYAALVTEVLLMLFMLKTYLYQSGYPQTVVEQTPSILIAIATQIFTKVYTIIIKNITNFQNHKTVTEYEGSLVIKSSIIVFIINFFSIFIYAYFSGYLASSYICQIRTTQTNVKITNCNYFLSSLLMSMIMVDFATTIIGAITPYLIFKGKEWWESRQIHKTSKFNYSFFESIDNFYEEQDRMDTYMYTEELDRSWLGYMNIVNVFAATALFAPALPFSYAMMFLTGVVRLHASKYDVIYLKKRILPTKTNSIHWWLNILEIISFLSVITNVGYIVYTRSAFVENQAKIFFLFVIIMLGVKYFMLAQYTSGVDIMAKRNEIKTSDIIKNRRKDQFENIPEELNTDIENVIYDEAVLNRKFHNVTKANIKEKEAGKND